MEAINWCGYNWKCAMEGGRLIHPKEPWMWYDHSQISIQDDGTLVLKMKERSAEVYDFEGNVYNPSLACGLIRSVEDFDYGTFSADIMLPKGTNLWPSFWISGSENWPPEIDIMEAWLNEKGKYFRWLIPQFPWVNPSWRTTTNVHYNTPNLKIDNCGSRNISWFKQRKDPSEQFIEYKCIWEPETITFFVNGKKTRTISGKICKYLTENLEHPDKTYKINVIFNVLCENPEKNKISLTQPMYIKDFKYEPLKK